MKALNLHSLPANLFLKYRNVKFILYHEGYLFGGDYENVENIYGHLLFAKEVIGNVLIEKVKSRYFSEDEALKIAHMILHDNAVNLFKLKH